MPSKFIVQLQKLFHAKPTKPTFSVKLRDINMVNIREATQLVRFELGIEDGSYRTWKYTGAIKDYKSAMKWALGEAKFMPNYIWYHAQNNLEWVKVAKYATERLEFLDYLDDLGYISYK